MLKLKFTEIEELLRGIFFIKREVVVVVSASESWMLFQAKTQDIGHALLTRIKPEIRMIR